MGSSPGWTYGYVPTAGEWNAEFASKEDELGYTPVNQAGDTMEGPLVTAPSTASAANFIIPEGISPSVPANGDLWMTTSGLYYKAGNNVVGPLNNGVTAWKQAASYATTSALPSCTYDNGTLGVGATLTATASGALIVDGGAVTVGQRLLIKNQVAAADNGVYVVTQAGSAGAPWILTRAEDYDQSSNAQAGDSLNVLSGDVNTNTFWVQVTVVSVMGTDPITFSQFAPAYQAGTGLLLDGATFAIDTSVTADLTSAQTLENKTLVAPDLGTPSALNLTNATGLPTSAMPEGAADLPIVGNGTSAPSYRALPLGDGVTGLLPTANGGEANCATRNVLASINYTNNTVAWLAEAGRQGWFQWSAANLSAQVTIDTQQGIYVPPASDPTGASGAWVRVTDGFWLVEWFGAVGDGVTDDAPAIQCAIDLLPALGGRILLRFGAIYAISETITMGDSNGSALSTKNGVQIFGGGMGLSGNEAGGDVGSTVLKWIGASGGTAVQMLGPMQGCWLQGITVEANSLAATGFDLIFPIQSHFIDLDVDHQIGQAFIHDCISSSSLPIGSYGNVFQNLKAILPVSGSGAGGITIGNDTWVSPQGGRDVVRNIYVHLEMARDGSTAGTASIRLRFLDNCQFYSTYTSVFFGTDGAGLEIDPPAGQYGFPNEISFFGAAIDSFSSPNDPSLWAPLGGVGFYGFSLGDGEELPADSGSPGAISGITTVGEPFGGNSLYNAWTPTIGVNAGSGYTFTLVSARYSKNFGEVFFSATFEVTAMGTGASGVTLTLPVNATDAAAVSAFNGVGGACFGVIVTASAGIVTVRKYDQTFPASAAGQFITVSGTYKA